jgi:formiminoglutamase
MFDYLESIQLQHITGDESYNEGQFGKIMHINLQNQVYWEDADIVLVGINEQRGIGEFQNTNHTNSIRKQFYSLYHWHNQIKIVDIGNIKTGEKLKDTYAAVKIVLSELFAANKTVIILGGSHDITLSQYKAYSHIKTRIEVTCIDAKLDLSLESIYRADDFLVEMLTGEPNYVKHYNHLGFQSYFVHPNMMETLDNLRFDCYRVGRVREKMQEFEAVFRNSNMVSIDVNALQNNVMPCNTLSPNGFAGDEACMLTKFAGFSTALNSLGIYNYNSTKDPQELGAMQIAQMIWYFIDGRQNLIDEKDIAQKEYYNEFITAFNDSTISFYQNKINNRWWMQMPNSTYIACNYSDYLQASQNEIPEIWLRYQERLVD